MNNAMTQEKAASSCCHTHCHTPRVDVFESEQELTLHADMPGVQPDSIDLRYEQGELVLTGKANPAARAGRALLAEYHAGDFRRVFKLHDSLDAGKIEAEYKNGVLIVHLPKKEAVKPKQVAVKVG